MFILRTFVRGEMKSEIFLYGRFIYGHRLGRYFCPDDLNLKMQQKTGAIWLLFAFGGLASVSRHFQRRIYWQAISHPHGTWL